LFSLPARKLPFEKRSLPRLITGNRPPSTTQIGLLCRLLRNLLREGAVPPFLPRALTVFYAILPYFYVFFSLPCCGSEGCPSFSLIPITQANSLSPSLPPSLSFPCTPRFAFADSVNHFSCGLAPFVCVLLRHRAWISRPKFLVFYLSSPAGMISSPLFTLFSFWSTVQVVHPGLFPLPCDNHCLVPLCFCTWLRQAEKFFPRFLLWSD